MIVRLGFLFFTFLLSSGPAMSQLSYLPVAFSELEGWESDDHEAALSVFRKTCGDIDRPDYRRLCQIAHDGHGARAFFETFFQPVEITDGSPPLFTGYFEPELNGSTTRTERYRFPIYRKPPELRSGQAFATRREIEENGILANRGLEIAWLEDSVDRFFLQVQGSGRIKISDGNVLRVGFAAKNGHRYSSVGRALVERGALEQHQISADAIRNWVRRNPEEGRELLWINRSYVFFREINEVPAEQGPLGAMARSITTMRSIAVDPNINLLGSPIWIEKSGQNPLNRLMIAQDTGSAIKGPQRADIFFGTGLTAGIEAGRIRDGGRMVVLMPIEYALSKLADAQE